MKLTLSTLAVAALFIAATSNAASAQVTKVVTHSADPNTHTISRNATVTGPNGQQAVRARSTTNNGNGTVTRVASQTGFGGRTRYAATTAGNGVATQTVTRRNGTVINRTRVR